MRFCLRSGWWSLANPKTRAEVHKSDTALLYNKNVGKLIRLITILFLLLGSFAPGHASVFAQQDDTSQYFADTGHNVVGDFWVFYRNFPNAQFVIGSPITEQYVDAASGHLIQYFQRARIEYRAELPEGQRVVLSPLGEYVFARSGESPSLDLFTSIGCRYYPDEDTTTGFSVCYAFLEFFDKYGGEAVFGHPKSPFVFYNGRIVQYFERARFEWYPEYPEGQRVVLSELGRIYFDMVPEDSTRLQPVKPDNFPGRVLTLYARVFTWKAVTRLDDQQIIYVVVQDQTLAPVAGATAIVKIVWPNGGTQSVALDTNEHGIIALPIQVQQQPHGSLVTIEVEVRYDSKVSNSVTSFRVWQ